MQASRRRRSIWWWFWTYFVVNTSDITLFSHVIIGIDHGREGVMATTPEWFVVWRRDVPRAQVGRELRQQHPSDLLSGAGTSQELRSRDVPAPDNKSLGCCCRSSLPTVINPLNISLVWGIFGHYSDWSYSIYVKYVKLVVGIREYVKEVEVNADLRHREVWHWCRCVAPDEAQGIWPFVKEKLSIIVVLNQDEWQKTIRSEKLFDNSICHHVWCWVKF